MVRSLVPHALSQRLRLFQKPSVIRVPRLLKERLHVTIVHLFQGVRPKDRGLPACVLDLLLEPLKVFQGVRGARQHIDRILDAHGPDLLKAPPVI